MQVKLKGSRFSDREKILGWCWVLFTTALARADLPTITSQQGSIIYHEAGSVLNLTCSAQNLSIAWYYENVPLQHRIFDNWLEISDLGFQQAGWYTCAASNPSGRAEREFLVVVGEQPQITFQLTQPIRVEEMTRVEIPCVVEGSPYPEVRWFNDADEIIDGGFDRRYRVDPITNSLVIYNFNSTDVQGFYCNVTNRFGTASSSRVEMVTNSGGPDLQSPFNDLPSHITLTTTENYELPCTNLNSTEISQLNLQVNWTQNQSELRTADPNMLILNGSSLDTGGYYCCNVSQLQNRTSATILNTHCVTVVVGTEPRFNTTSPNASSVQTGRTVNLHCQGNTTNRFDPPSFDWSRNNIQLQAGTTGSVTVSQTNLGMSFLSIEGTQTGDTGIYTCTGRNNLSTTAIVRNITVRVVDTCTLSDNALHDHNAEEENPLSSWTPSDMDANFTTISNERVFTVTYNSSGPEFSRLVQTLTVPSNSTRAYVSGRIRHTTRPLTPGSFPGIALINVTLDEDLRGILEQPFPTLESWQWVGHNYSITGGGNMSVVLTVRRGEGEDHIQGTAYFDDLCVSFTQDRPTQPEPTTQAPPPGLTFNMIIAISAGAGGGAFLLLFLILLLCSCCCRKSSKNAAKRMRKMSTIIKMRFSKSEMQTHNLGAEDDHTYEVESSIQKPNEDSKEDYVDTYTDIDQNAPTYTPLNRNLLEGEHLYAAPSPHVNGDDDLEPDALQDKEYGHVKHGSQASSQIHQLTASSQPNQRKKTPLDPITGEIYSYVND